MYTTKGLLPQIFLKKIYNIITQNQISWDKCVAFSVDNASMNMSKRNAIKSRVLVKNPDVYFVGCPCHMAHNAACKAFLELLDLSVDLLLVWQKYKA